MERTAKTGHRVRPYDDVRLTIAENRVEMGLLAAEDAAQCLRELLQEEEEINCIFAAAPSQNEFLKELAKQKDVAWHRVNAWHMDEYIGFPVGDPRSFSGFLLRAFFEKVPLKSVNLIDGLADPEAEAFRYGELLRERTVHVTFMGIGENGHIAFNDPGVADFNDPLPMKVVTLDVVCRMQQVHDGCFPELEDVPRRALTLTCPLLTSARYIFCVVPGETKYSAVRQTLLGAVDPSCPASILRRSGDVRMYIDRDCAGNLEKESGAQR